MNRTILLVALISLTYFGCKKEDEKQKDQNVQTTEEKYQDPQLIGTWIKDSTVSGNDIMPANDTLWYLFVGKTWVIYLDRLIITKDFFKVITEYKDSDDQNEYSLDSYYWHSKGDSILSERVSNNPFYNKNYRYAIYGNLLKLYRSGTTEIYHKNN